MIRKKRWFWPFLGLVAYGACWGLTVMADAIAATPLTRVMIVEAITNLGIRDGAVVQFQGKNYRLTNVSVSEPRPGDFSINFKATPH